MFLKKKLFGLLVCTAPLVSLTSYGAMPKTQSEEQVQTQQSGQQQQGGFSISDVYAKLQKKCHDYKNDPAGQRDPNFKVTMVCDAERLSAENRQQHTRDLLGEGTQAITFKVKAEDHVFDPYEIAAPHSHAVCETVDIVRYTPKSPITVDLTCDQLTPEAVTQACHDEFNRVCPETTPDQTSSSSSSSSSSDSSSDGVVAQQQQQKGGKRSLGCERKKVDTVDTCGFYN